jgi:ABC-type transport system involved in Fe-S cluster assembly fused permease/ATPase subunit
MEIYKPNIGWIFWAQMILVLAVIVPILIICVIVWFTHGILLPVLVPVLAIVILTLMVVALTSYTMDCNEMMIKGAFGKRSIQYSSVTKVVDTNKGMINESMFVLSSDRVIIFYDESKKVSISPRNKSDALNVLRSHCPNAAFEEDLKVKGEASQKKPLFAERDPMKKEKEPKVKKEKKPRDNSRFKLP